MTNFPKKEEKFFEARLKVTGFVFQALWDEKGSLMALCLKPENFPNILKKFSLYFGHFSLDKAPKELKFSLKRVLEAYFCQKRLNITYPVHLVGTPFEKRVWWTLREVPPGEVRTYKWLAERIGVPKAFRAVGRALAANPLPIFIPCHRIVSARGLGGFSAGLEWKRYLLCLEGVKSPSSRI